MPDPTTILAATRELEIETHIDNTVRDAQAFRRLIQRTIMDAQTFTNLGFIPGYDRESILGLLKDWLPPDDAAVARWAEDNFVRSDAT